MNFNFKPVSTGKKVGSLNDEPALYLYPETGRMRLNHRALKAIGESIQYVTVLKSDNYLCFVKDNNQEISRGCKIDKNNNFTSAETVKPLGLTENSKCEKHVIYDASELGIDGIEGKAIVFDLSSIVESEEGEEGEEGEKTEAE